MNEPNPRPRRLEGILIALLAIATAPLPFLFFGRDVWWAGLPVWLWWSLGFTVALSLATARMMLTSDWDDDDE
jgi:hypothetical protein